MVGGNDGGNDGGNEGGNGALGGGSGGASGGKNGGSSGATSSSERPNATDVAPETKLASPSRQHPQRRPRGASGSLQLVHAAALSSA